MSQLINQVLYDRYYIQSLLGKKTGRRTFIASDLQNNTPVIIKLLLFGPDFAWDDLKLFEREAETLKILQHPLIPQYLNSFEVETELGKGFALVQSYIEAQSLQDWIQAGRSFSEEELRAIAKELLEILDYLHSHQPPVIHRDIKPSNILLDNRSGNSPGKIYLVDFGSLQTVASDGTITVVGTYGYMPPEQFGGKTTPASDLYSLGATLIYLITRTHPADLPSHNGHIQFVAKHLNEQFQTWLRYLIQPDASQRCTSAQEALTALHSKQLVLPSRTVRSKPAGSNVLLTKTDEKLKIVIPPPPLKRKIQVIGSVLWTTTVICSPLLLFFWKPAIGLFVTPIILWVVVSIWTKTIYTIFATIQLSIDPREMCFLLDLGRLGLTRRYSSPTKDIIKLERINFKPSSENIETAEKHYSGVYIWAGNQRYSLGANNPTSGERINLTEVEQDWLAVELSDWLDLPIQTSGEAPTLEHQSQASTKAMNIEAESIESDSAVDLSFSTQPSEVIRPENTLCNIIKGTDKIEISAPAKSGFYFKLLGCFFSIPIVIILLAMVGTNPALALFLGFIPTALMGIGNYVDSHNQTIRIVLIIDQHDISLWEQSYQTGKQRCIKEEDCSAINKLRLFYKTDKQGKQRCHVKVDTKNLEDNFEDEFIIGNQTFWLSRVEADWLAHELSICLKLPVTEVEVRESNTAGPGGAAM